MLKKISKKAIIKLKIGPEEGIASGSCAV